jgi:long-chain acyl-CoA synthetase
MQAFKEEEIGAMLVVPRFLSLLKNTIERELSQKHLIGLLRFQITKKIISRTIHKKFGRNFQMFAAGGAALPLDVFAFWKDLGFRVIEGYGLTECSPIVSGNTFKKQIPGSVGRPLKEVKVKVDNNELLVKGDNVFEGYYQNSQETEKAFKDGWFRTGDFVDVDKSGNIFIKGRKKDVIVNSSGVNIYPTEIESVLNKIDDVKDSAVLGLDTGSGEEVHAVLLLKNKNYDPAKIIKSANENLDPLAQITGFSVWEEFDFPRTTTLKVQKFRVREKILASRSAQFGEAKYQTVPGEAGRSGLNQNSKDKLDLNRDTLISLLSNVSKKAAQEIKENSILTSDLGLNSLSRIELVNYLEQEYRVDLEDTMINQNTTVADLRILLEKRGKIKKQRGLWLWLNNSIGRGIREFLDTIFHKPISHLFFDLKTHGLANLKSIKGPVVFIANHVSYLDQPAIMYSLDRNLRYKTASATREEFFFSQSGTSFFGKILFPYSMIGFNTFFLPQKSGFRKSLSFMGKLIDSGVNILIFPEGTRSKNGKLQDFMSGLGLLVKELQVPVVPIRILGMEKIYPRGAIFPKKGKCQVIFGKPLEFTTESPSEIIEISRNAVLDLTKK